MQTEKTISAGKLCELGDTKCENGHVYICQIGPDMKEDWFYTVELCGELQCEVVGDTAVTKRAELTATTRQVQIPLYGVIGELSPRVYVYHLSSAIQAIAGQFISIEGVAQFGGIGTNVLTVAVTAGGVIGNYYKGQAVCTVTLR